MYKTVDVNEKIELWERTDGVDLIKNNCIKKGSTIIDFGCSIGHYVIPIALVVGEQGKVFAVDKNKYSLELLNEKALKMGLNNIETVYSKSRSKLDFKNESIDGILFYDILHSGEIDLTKIILESKRILKKDGLLSILPFHLSYLEINSLLSRIINMGFQLIESKISEGLHFEMFYYLQSKHSTFDEVEKGKIYNFIKL